MNKSVLSIFALVFSFNAISAQLSFNLEKSSSDPLLIQMDQKIMSGEYEEITSVLIARGGEVIFEKYYNESDKSSLHNTRSATKTIATLLTGIAIDKGFLPSEKR